jgi:hypothetical protein
MKTSSLYVLGATLSLSVLSAYANIICTTIQNPHTRFLALAEAAIIPRDPTPQPLENLCKSQFGDAGFLIHRVGSTVYTITRTDDTNTLHGREDHFETIKRQCTAEEGHQGGTVLANGVLYEVFHDEAAHLETAGRASSYDRRSGGIKTGIARPGKRVIQPAAPKTPATPKAPTAPKIPTAPKTPTSPKAPTAPKTPTTPKTPKACPLKPKGKCGKSLGGKASKRADTSNPDCEDEDDLESIWNKIPAGKKAKGDSALPFTVDPNKSEAWGITYLYGCTAIMISDPKYVLGKSCFLFGASGHLYLWRHPIAPAFAKHYICSIRLTHPQLLICRR